MTSSRMHDLIAAGDRLYAAAEQHEWARAMTANAMAGGDDDDQQRAIAAERAARDAHHQAIAAYVANRVAASAEEVAAYIDQAGDPLV